MQHKNETTPDRAASSLKLYAQTKLSNGPRKN